MKRSYAAFYALVEKARAKVAGFYTLSPHCIALTDLPADIARKLRRYPSVAALLTGWLGCDASFRGRHAGIVEGEPDSAQCAAAQTPARPRQSLTPCFREPRRRSVLFPAPGRRLSLRAEELAHLLQRGACRAPVIGRLRGVGDAGIRLRRGGART